MSYLAENVPGLAARCLRGSYTAHGDGRRYVFTARWCTAAPSLRWTASVANERGEAIASPEGSIAHDVLRGGDAATWVRAAVELAIERIAHRPAV